MLWATTVETVVVGLPARGKVNVTLTPAGKAELERVSAQTRVKIEIDRPRQPQALAAVMNTYVVWAVSPEGFLENVGELELEDGKARFDGTTRFDQLGLLITAEPHYMVDRPSDAVAYRSRPPESASIRRFSVPVETGAYDYSKLQPGAPGIASQARAAFQIAVAAQADRLAESEFRLARAALDTMEEMLKRAAPLDFIMQSAHESIRRFQRAFLIARERTASMALENADARARKLEAELKEVRQRLQELETSRPR